MADPRGRPARDVDVGLVAQTLPIDAQTLVGLARELAQAAGIPLDLDRVVAALSQTASLRAFHAIVAGA